MKSELREGDVKISHRGFTIRGYRDKENRAVASASYDGMLVMAMWAELLDIDVEIIMDRMVLAIDAVMFPVYYPRGEDF